MRKEDFIDYYKDFIRADFKDEHSNDRFKFLNSCWKLLHTKGSETATSKILKLIPSEKLSNLVGSYRFAHIFEATYKEMTTDSKALPSEFPKKELRKVRQNLEILEDKQWLNVSSVNKIQRFIKEQLVYSFCGSQYIYSTLLKTASNTGGRGFKDEFLDELVYELIQELKQKNKRLNYGLIATFLSEQGISSSDGLTDDGIRKRYKRFVNSGFRSRKMLDDKANILSLFQKLRVIGLSRGAYRQSIIRTEKDKQLSPAEIEKLLDIFEEI